MFALEFSASAIAQGAPPVPDATTAIEIKKQRNLELEALRAEQKNSAGIEIKLKLEIESIGEDRRKLNQALIDTAARLRSAENDIALTQQRLRDLDDREGALRGQIDGRRETLVEVLAALQRIGRRPLPAIMARPEDALTSVRIAIMLGAVLPEMQQRMAALAADLSDLVNIRQDIVKARDRLLHDLARLSEERQRVSLLVEERQKRRGEAEEALAAERRHTVELARQAGNLEDLIARLEAGGGARQAAPRPTESHPNLNALKNSGRIGPAVAFASARGMLPLPVNGAKIREFGTPDGLGGTEKGLFLSSQTGAQVTAPCDGWVVYAGPFRSYGQLLILNTGGGYHVLLAGMERISVEPGQFVLMGEPVAIMGNGSKAASTIGVASSQPVLYIEFRKDGSPVDPTPWWATNDIQKVRG
jgi:septal ring factor EnvC (AmiA/AmiB activator)